jgi:hypothetical protein
MRRCLMPDHRLCSGAARLISFLAISAYVRVSTASISGLCRSDERIPLGKKLYNCL